MARGGRLHKTFPGPNKRPGGEICCAEKGAGGGGGLAYLIKGELSEGLGGTFVRRTLFNTATSQEPLNGTHSKAHNPNLGVRWLHWVPTSPSSGDRKRR